MVATVARSGERQQRALKRGELERRVYAVAVGRVPKSALATLLLTLTSGAAAQAPSTEPAQPSVAPTSDPLGTPPPPPPGAMPNAPPQPPAYAPPYPPGYYPAYPPPYAYPAPQAPPERKTNDEQVPGYHLHDGFFMRFAGGLGYLNIDVEPETTAVTTAALDGFGLSWEIDFGWAIVPGVVVGGAYGGVVAFDPHLEGGQRNPRTNSGAALTIGPLIAVFPDPRAGFEIGGSVGLAGISYSFEDPSTLVVRSETLSGVGGTLWFGFNDWVSANWSLGVLARGGIAWVENRETVETSTAIIEFDQSGTGWTLGLFFNPMFQ